MRKMFLLPLLLACFAGPGLGLAGAAGLAIDLNLLGTSPLGEYSDGTDASDVFDSGGGISGGVSFGVADVLSVGGEIGFYRNSGEIGFDFDFFDVDLTSIPIHGILAFHSGGGDGSIGFYGKGGLGITRHSASIDVSGVEDVSQTNFSFQLGGGITYGLSETWDLQVGLAYHQTQTPDDCFDLADDEGPFCDDDNPKFLLLNLGARYHAAE